MEPLEYGQWYRFTRGGYFYIMIYHGRTNQGNYIIEQAYGNGGMTQEYVSAWAEKLFQDFKIEKVPPGTTR